MSDLCPVAASVNAVNLEDQPETIGGSLLWLLESKKFCDVIFTFPNVPERIEAHEFCLKARSPVFEQIFRMRRSGNVEGKEIEICESTPERFQQFLEFIYSDKFDVDIAGALDLLQLSQKYKVHPLTKKCEELMQSEILIPDSIKTFQAARRYGCQELNDRAGRVMVKSFFELVGTGALANAEEETLVYLLQCDDLAVKEVGLFQIILDWAKDQVGTSASVELLRDKLENLIPKIRYTNMAPDEFTKVVVPTGLLSAEDSLSVYTYLCGDEVTRRSLKTKFNTTRRKVESREAVTKFWGFYTDEKISDSWFPAFSKQCISFKADQMQVDGKVLPNYFLKKTAITGLSLRTPAVNVKYKKGYVFNMNVSIWEYCGPVKEGKSTVRFQKTILNCDRGVESSVSVEPPVDLIAGRTYSAIVEDLSTYDLMDRFRKDPDAYWGLAVSKVAREANINLEDVCLTLEEVQRNTDYYLPYQSLLPEDLAIIRGIKLGLV